MNKSTLPLILTAFLISILPGLLSAQKATETQKKWLSEHIQAPSTSILFQLNLSGSQLDIHTPVENTAEVELPGTIKELNTLLEKDSMNVDVYLKRFDLQLKKEGQDAALEGFQTGLNRYLQALEVHPDSFELVMRSSEFFFAAGDPSQVIQLVEMFLQKNPDHAEAHTFVANQYSLYGGFDRARMHIDKAYELDPKLEDIYVSEWMFQWMLVMVEYDQTGVMNYERDRSFLVKAMAEQKGLPAPRIVLHALTLSTVLVDVVIKQQDAFIEQKPFTFELSEDHAARVEGARIFFEELLVQPPQNPYVLQKCLALAYVLKSDIASADKIFKSSKKNAHSDTDIHRVMTIGWVTQARFMDAADVLKESFGINESADNRLLYARLLADAGDPAAAAKSLSESGIDPNPEMQLARVSYLIQAGDWNAASALKSTLLGPFEGQAETTNRYLGGIYKLLEGKNDSAKLYFDVIGDDQHYKISIEKIKEYFKLTTE